MPSKIKNVFLKRNNKEIARRKMELDSFLTKAHGPKGYKKRNEYEKLTSGRVFKSRFFKVTLQTERYKLNL